MDVVLPDYVKVFNNVPYQCLLHKLDYYGVCNTTLHWIESFLNQRKQSVLLDGAKSSEADMLSGVPQGTVLGTLLIFIFRIKVRNLIPECNFDHGEVRTRQPPILFLAFINDLSEVTKHSDARLPSI